MNETPIQQRSEADINSERDSWHGFTRLDNDLLSALVKCGLSAPELEIVLLILRYTTGFQRDHAALSISFLARATGRHRNCIQRGLKALESRGIINRIPPTFRTAAQFQIAPPATWRGTSGVTVTQNEPVPQSDMLTVTQNGTESHTEWAQERKSFKETSKQNPGSRKLDPACEAFQRAFLVRFKSPYKTKKADFLSLCTLRKTLTIGSRDMPPEWQKACSNYLATDNGRPTLADLAQPERYAVFREGARDRFGKLITKQPDPSNGDGRNARGELLYEPNQR